MEREGRAVAGKGSACVGRLDETRPSMACLPSATPTVGGACATSRQILFVSRHFFLRAQDRHGFRAKSNPQLVSMDAIGLGACHVERSASIPRTSRESQPPSRNIPTMVTSYIPIHG